MWERLWENTEANQCSPETISVSPEFKMHFESVVWGMKTAGEHFPFLEPFTDQEVLKSLESANDANDYLEAVQQMVNEFFELGRGQLRPARRESERDRVGRMNYKSMINTMLWGTLEWKQLHVLGTESHGYEVVIRNVRDHMDVGTYMKETGCEQWMHILVRELGMTEQEIRNFQFTYRTFDRSDIPFAGTAYQREIVLNLGWEDSDVRSLIAFEELYSLLAFERWPREKLDHQQLWSSLKSMRDVSGERLFSYENLQGRYAWDTPDDLVKEALIDLSVLRLVADDPQKRDHELSKILTYRDGNRNHRYGLVVDLFVLMQNNFEREWLSRSGQKSQEAFWTKQCEHYIPALRTMLDDSIST